MPIQKKLVGKRFGRLVVLRDTGRNDGKKPPRRLWECLCDCGNLHEVTTANLTKGTTRSCGCLAMESATKSMKQNSTILNFGADSEIFKASKEKGTRKYVERYVKEGTNLKNLTSKIGRNNKSGVKGVCWDKSRSKWVAYIRVQGKRISLGRYADKEEAIQVRKEAEEQYFDPILRKYQDSQTNG